ncbi:hypothetical protein DMC30DRAFT_16277 [Rhodotorula diobovata]|uniref:Uncharacterized protein n=1 Tax=Rhodotorula diobovata TaxID=5288 RepID=A0A5C5FQL2_9BASI|nr:hypothetical protein DMC30DRAFT_16277 [Rhodotorula diobovata]
MVPRVRERWLFGLHRGARLQRGRAATRRHRGLIMRITPSLPLSLVLTPCDEPPVSLVSVLAHVINPYLTASQDRVNAVNTKKQLDRLSTEHDKVRKLLDNERDANKRQRRVPGTQLRHFSGDSTSNGGGAPFARRRSSQEQSQGASQSQGQGQGARQSQGGYGGGTQQSPTEERELSLSPSKAIPGVTHRGVLTPGDPGSAGSSRRIGRVGEGNLRRGPTRGL